MEAQTAQSPSVSTTDKIPLTSAMNLGRADQCLSKKSKSREWTDEKHSLYLKSMEASFLNQLYESRSLISTQRNIQPSGQFKILQGGCWDKISFGRGGEYPPNKAAGNKPANHVLAADPWIRRLRPQQNTPFKQQYCCNSNNVHLCHHEPSHDKEVSDQNFDDDDNDDDDGDVKRPNECSSKRMRLFHS